MDYINSSILNSNILEPEEMRYLDKTAGIMKGLMEPALYRHSLGTLEFALQMAGSCRQEVDIFRLAAASLIHDYGKIFTVEELRHIIKKDKLDISGFELGLSPILHSLAGGHLISRDLDIRDEKILRAVRIHTIGAENMTAVEKILFIADKVEKTRKYRGVGLLRELALKDINLCLIEVYKNTIIYVMNKKGLLHPGTSGIWNNICGGK